MTEQDTVLLLACHFGIEFTFCKILTGTSISVLQVEGGHHLLPELEMFVIKGSLTTEAKMVPNLGGELPPAIVHLIKELFRVDILIDVVDPLRRGGMEPDQIDFVTLSHIHFDHIGDPCLFSSRSVVGAASEGFLFNGYAPNNIGAGSKTHLREEFPPPSRTTYVPSEDWEPIGPSPGGHDFFGDGSLCLIDSPGNMDPHINILVRMTVDGSWLCLGGDSAHDVCILSGEEISTFLDPVTGGMTCMHKGIEIVKEHIGRIKQAHEIPKVHVLMAHDLSWYEENKHKEVIFSGEMKPM